MLTATDRKSESSTATAQLTAAKRQLLRKRLLAWYAKHARDLPWRRSSDPYRIWVSEIMLQQTQVATVREYFQRFIAALPNVRQLAATDEQQVLRLWEGLGYYRRARQLHAAAKRLVAEYEGKFPQRVEDLMTLPGICRYTAGAIASIAFGQRAPILEANTVRLLSRLIGYREDPLRTAGQRVLWQTATEILPRAEVARFNQALMELGSLVCTPADPKCGECPLTTVCIAFASGLQHEIPREKPRQECTSVREAAIIVRHNGSVLMRQCTEGERWAGLWDFPRFAVEAEGPLFAQREIAAKVREQTGITCSPGSLVHTLKHGVTRYRITLDCYEADYASGRARYPAHWVKAAKLANLPLSTTGRKIASLIKTKKSQRDAE